MHPTRKRNEWYKRFFAGLYSQVLGRQFTPERNRQQALLIKRLLKLRKGQSILDCPCGMGRLTVPLSGLGLNAVGVDLNAAFIRKARSSARKCRVKARFLQADMRELPFEGEFDAVINWFTSFGYFDDGGNLATAQAAMRALKPGGKFLIELLSKSWLASRFTHEGHDDVAGIHIDRRSRWNAKGDRVINTWTFSKGNKREVQRFSHCLYSGKELRALLRKAGFVDVRLYGRPPLGRFTRHSRRLIAIGTKPGK